MAGRIPPHFIDELVSRIDIVELIDERVPLKKAGRDFKACCPFHGEKTPSFTVSQAKQFYHCFGCGAHGTAIGFLMDYAHMDFVEAVEELAARLGLDVPREAGRAEETAASEALFALLAQADEFYRRQLRSHPDAPAAVEYLKKRGLSGAVARDFGIGFAPPGWDSLVSALGGDAKRLERLVSAGLATTGETGRPYDRFRNRVMFPIRDGRGRVVGFGGRVLDDATPKYLNSPETPVFHKGRELYGLHEARRAGRGLARLLVVEGYMDVVALAQFGVSYAVATLGTAATTGHMERLFRATDTVVFCFDGDEAGARAAWRALENALPLLRDGRQASFMFLPQGEDPDTLVRREGREAFEARMAEARGAVEFLLEHLAGEVDMQTLEGRARLVEQARPLLAKLPPGALRELAGSRLAELTGLETGSRALHLSDTATPGAAHPALRRPAPVAGSPSLVRTVITWLLHHPALVGEAGETGDIAHLDRPGAALLAAMLEVLRAHPNLSTGGLLERFREHEQGRYLGRLASVEVPALEEPLREEFRDAIQRLRSMRDDQRFAELQHKASSGPLSPPELREYAELSAGSHAGRLNSGPVHRRED